MGNSDIPSCLELLGPNLGILNRMCIFPIPFGSPDGTILSVWPNTHALGHLNVIGSKGFLTEASLGFVHTNPKRPTIRDSPYFPVAFRIDCRPACHRNSLAVVI